MAELCAFMAGGLAATSMIYAVLSAALVATNVSTGSGYGPALISAICGAAAGFFIVKTIRFLR